MLVVVGTCGAAFGIALRSFFSDVDQFGTVESTFTVLFDAALGQHNFTIFDSGTSSQPYRSLGVALFIIYILLMQVVLLNMIIAQMTVS